jgi:putative methionine-R-sulfoxide reductase with GAF domain
METSPERRRCLRHKVNAPAFASFDGVTGGMILDLSEQGMSMHTAAPLESHRRIQLHLSLPEPATYLDTEGYIAWADALGRAGVRFSDLPEDARTRLNAWLTLNATSPSRKAPKFAVGEFSRSPLGAASPGKSGKDREHLEISLEPETSAAEKRGRGPASTTVQYEFNPLGPDLNAALRLISERACSLTRGSGAAIALRQNGSMKCRATVGECAPPLGTELETANGLSGECIRTGKAQRCDDAENDPRVDLETCRLLRIRSVVAGPIRYEREIVGLLEVFSHQSFAFDEGDVAVVGSLAHTVLLALSHYARLKRG